MSVLGFLGTVCHTVPDFKVSQILSFQLRILNIYFTEATRKHSRKWRLDTVKSLRIHASPDKTTLTVFSFGGRKWIQSTQKTSLNGVLYLVNIFIWFVYRFLLNPSSINPKLTERKPHCRPTGHTVFQFLHCTVRQERTPDMLTKLTRSQ